MYSTLYNTNFKAETSDSCVLELRDQYSAGNINAALNSIAPLKGLFSLSYSQHYGHFAVDLSWTLVA